MQSDHRALSSHGDAHHETLDLEPVRTLPPDEAPSPAWLPFVGAALVLLSTTAWALGRSNTASAPSLEPAKLSASPAAPASNAAPSVDGAPRRTADRRPNAGPGRERSAEELNKIRELRRKYEEQRQEK